ncbi:MAG: tetratricopeptide repeat protein [Candidatus Riflebacteria bacterium]|nr:tetratricopeptide repeat protein [Candidatus Riflebacteria bacterium]
MKGQRYHEVVRDLSDVLSRSPENPEARLYLALAYSKIGEFERSEKEFREAVRLHPDNAGIRANLALALMEMGRAAEAISEGKTALRDLPRQPKNQFQTAVALFRIPELRDDLAGFLEKVVELQPALGQAHLMLADIYLRRQDLDLAIRSMEAARKAPNPPPWLEAKIGELRAQRRDGR